MIMREIILDFLRYKTMSSAFSVSWVRQLAALNTAFTETVPNIRNDSAGNSYVVYVTVGTVSGGTLRGSTDIVLTKISNTGTVTWVRQIAAVNTGSAETVPQITVDSAGNSYITYITPSVVSSGTSTTSSDVVVARFDTNGNLTWIRQNTTLNTTSTEATPSIAIDSTGASIYLSYSTGGTISGGLTLGGTDIVVVKMATSTGNITWIRQVSAMNTSSNDTVPSIAVDNLGNSYVAYQTAGTISGGTFLGASDIVVVKMDTNGSVTWVRQYFSLNTTVTEQIPAIAVDAGYNVYLSYVTNGAVSGGTFVGTVDIVVAKLASNGNLLWIRQQNTFNTGGSEIDPFVTVDSCGNAYIAYSTAGTVSGGVSAAGTDIVVLKMSNEGAIASMGQISAVNTSGTDNMPGISLDSSNNVYVTYQTAGTVSGGVLTGSTDIVVTRLTQTTQTATVPTAPTSATAVSGDSTSAIVSWVPAANILNAVVRSYTVTSSPGSFTATVDGSLTTATVTGLTYGTSYTFNVTATNSAGTSSARTTSAITIRSGPTVPTNVGYTYASGQITLSWAAPASTGDSEIASYTVTTSPFDTIQTTANASTTSVTLTGLSNGTPYLFSVRANNQFVSGPFATITAICSTIPNAPTVSPLVGDTYGSINVRCLPAAFNGGRAITSYTVTASPGGATAIAEVRANQITFVATFNNLTQGQAYTFTAVATNVDGNSLPSVPSTSMTPSSDLYYVNWLKQYPQLNTAAIDAQQSVVTDRNGNVFIAYNTQGTVSGGTFLGSSDVVVAKLDKNGQIQWIRQQALFNTISGDGFPVIAADPSGNIYITEYTGGTVSGGIFSGGSSDIVVFKMDTYGNLLWLKQQALVNTVGTDTFPTIAVDNSGNSYITYTATGAVSGGTFLGVSDIVVFKLDTSGRVQWVRQHAVMNTTTTDDYSSIAVDNNGFCYVTYTTAGTVSGGAFIGFRDIIVSKLNSNTGQVQWVRQNGVLNTTTQESFPTIAADSAGNTYLTYYNSGASVSGGIYLGSNELVVAKMDTNGNLLWIKQYALMSTTDAELYPRIAIDSVGNSYIAYYSRGTVSGGINISSGFNYSIVVAKLDSNGALLFVKQQPLMSLSFISFTTAAIVGIALDLSGNVVVMYSTTGTMSGGTNMGSADIALFKMAQHTLTAIAKPVISVSSQHLQAVVSWPLDANYYVNAITSYTVTANPGNLTVTVSDPLQTSATITGLVGGGTEYTFTMTANSAAGSATSDPVTKAVYSQPGAPTGLFTINGSQQLTVGWTAPTVLGELPITSYTVVSSPGGFTTTTANGSTTRAVVSGLSNGIPYTFTVYANTSGGRGLTSSPSAQGIPSTVPSTPSNITASPLQYYGALSVSWDMETNGGSTITSYTITANPGNIVKTSSTQSVTFADLNPSTAYTFTVTATNANGASAAGTSVVATNPSSELVYLQWIRQQAVMNTTGTESSGQRIATDILGNTYITYTTTGTVSGGTYLGNNDIVVLKMSPTGVVQWIREQAVMNSTGTDISPTIGVDTSGNIYVAYISSGTVSGGTNLASNDLVIFKMDTTGSVQWIREQAGINTTSSESSPSIAVDPSGNSYVSYLTIGTVSGGTNAGAGLADVAVLKMDTNGALQWIKQETVMNTILTDYVPSITVDISGNSYVAYYTGGTVSGGTAASINTAYWDTIVFKMSTTGAVQWIKQYQAMNSSLDDINASIGVDISGNVYIAYQTTSTVSGGTSAGLTDIVVSKLNADGGLQWVRQQQVMNSAASDTSASLAVDNEGSSYVAYTTTGTVSGGTNRGSSDIVVFKMDTGGTLQWIKEQAIMNSTLADTSPSLRLDSSKNIYVVYNTAGTVSGGTYLGSQDIVVFKMAQHVVSAPPTPTITAVAGNLSATVTWTMPPNPLVNPITSYVITSNLGDTITTNGNTNTATFTNLTGTGTSYTFTIVSTNALGTSSATSNTIQVYKLADAPVASGSSGNTEATLNWLPPSVTGDSAITNYTISWTPGNSSYTTFDNAATSFTAYSLTNGTTYKFTIVANGLYGVGNAATVFVTPSTLPSAVVVSPLKGNRYSEIILRLSCNTGGAAILSYNVTMNPGNISYVFGGSATPTLSNLDPSVGYTFTATATNLKGTSDMSSASTAFTPSSDLLYMDWVKQQALMNTSGSDYYPKIAIDLSGNSYVTYYTTRTVSGGTNKGSNDIVVTKLDTSGTVQWIKQQAAMNATSGDNNPAIAVDVSGNSYITHFSSGTVSGGTNKGSNDIVVTKLDTNGNLVWIQQQLNMNTTGADLYPTIILDSNGNIYVTYHTAGTVSGGTFLGSNDIVVFKMNNNGNLLWIKQHFSMNSTGTEANAAIGVDGAGNVYLTYYTAGTVSGGTNKGSNDIAVTKLDTNGNLVWIKQQLAMNTSGSDVTPFIAVDSAGNSYVTYYSSGAVSSGTFSGNNDIVVFKMDTNGNLVWIKEPTSVNTSASEFNPMIALDNSNNVYVSYSTIGTVSGGTNTGNNDIVFFKMDTNGDLQWVKQQSPINSIGNDWYPSIAVDKSSDAIYITYYTLGSVSGGQNIGDRDVVITKFSTHGTSVPSAPTNIAVSGGNAQANISWSHPFNGNSIITSYTVTAQPGNITYITDNGLITFATMTGLTNNITYTFTITATNSIGESSASSSVTALPTAGNTVPDPPTSVIASADYGSATVSWIAPLNTGGLPILNYIVIASPAPNGFATQTVSNSTSLVTFENLLNGITYNFTVKAVNDLGMSVASQAATASYTDPNVTGTLQSSLTDPTAVQSYLSGAITPTKTIQDNYIELRNSLKAANYTVTDNSLVIGSMTQGFQTMNGNPVMRLGPDYLPFFFNSVKSSTQILPPKSIQVLLPTYTNGTATYDFTTSPVVLDGTQYLHIEIPAGNSIQLTDNLLTKTLSYDGTFLSDGTTTYGIGNTITIGNKSYIVAAIGSVTLLPISPNKMVIMANNNGILKTQGNMSILAVSIQ